MVRRPWPHLVYTHTPNAKPQFTNINKQINTLLCGLLFLFCISMLETKTVILYNKNSVETKTVILYNKNSVRYMM